MVDNEISRWSDPEFLREMEATLSMLFVQKHAPGPVDLRGIVVGLDGAPQLLLSADFQNLVATGMDASRCKVSCSFSRSHLSLVRFVESQFDTCRFKAAKFESSAFDAAKFDSPTLDDASFTQCSFVQARISGRRVQEYGGRRVLFDRCDFRDATLRNLQLRACTFRDCTFENVRFEKCLIVGAKFEGGRPSDESFVACK